MHVLLQSLVQGLVYGGIYSVAALGFSLIYSTTGVFHIAYGAILTAGVYLVISCGGGDAVGGLVAGLAAGIALAAVLSVVIYMGIYRPMQRKGATTLELFVVSLGLNLALVALILIVFGAETRTFNFPGFFAQHLVGGLRISYLGLTCIALGLVALLTIEYVGRRTLLGQQMRAVSANVELAQLRGVHVSRVIAGVYAAGAALSVIAGVLIGMSTSVTSESGTNLTLLAAIATLLGGQGAYRGAYIGGLIVGMVSAISAALLPGQWSTAAVFGAFIVIVLVRPEGLLRQRFAV